MTRLSKPRRRLSFLRIFLRSVVGKLTSIPSAVIPLGRLKMNLFVDDINLSTAKRIVSFFGYQLCVQFVPPDQKSPGDKRYNRESRLFFLRDYIAKCGLSHGEFAEAIGLTRDAVTYWFRQDDIRISRLYRIALYLGADLNFSITPKVERKGGETTHPTTSFTIELQEETSITPDLLEHTID